MQRVFVPYFLLFHHLNFPPVFHHSKFSKNTCSLECLLLEPIQSPILTNKRSYLIYLPDSWRKLFLCFFFDLWLDIRKAEDSNDFVLFLLMLFHSQYTSFLVVLIKNVISVLILLVVCFCNDFIEWSF